MALEDVYTRRIIGFQVQRTEVDVLRIGADSCEEATEDACCNSGPEPTVGGESCAESADTVLDTLYSASQPTDTIKFFKVLIPELEESTVYKLTITGLPTGVYVTAYTGVCESLAAIEVLNGSGCIDVLFTGTTLVTFSIDTTSGGAPEEDVEYEFSWTEGFCP